MPGIVIAGRGELSREEKRMVANVIRGQSQSKWASYYSKVRFVTARTGSSTAYTYTIAAGTVVNAFGYAIGGDMATAGRSGTSATPADTNLVTASQTVSNETILIRGIGCQITPDSDPELAILGDASISVTMLLNGGNPLYRLGNPTMLPGGGGLFGAGVSNMITPPTNDRITKGIGAVSNGDPQSFNFFEFPEPVLWRPAGNPDSSLNVSIKAEVAVAYTNAGDVSAQASSSSFVGLPAFTSPTAAATFLAYNVVLFGQTFNELSGN